MLCLGSAPPPSSFSASRFVRFVICFDRRTNSLGVEMMHRGKAIKCEPTLRDLARTDSVREVYRRRRERLILGTGIVLGVMILGIGVRAFF
jgi:hypothetical protein